ncbi:hypothetical protein [Hyphobacterium sp.]|uniref:hypothetical protein n=1 Tax=Hyphobacterium sp. TaxID=2004662 RepID=UPI00374A4C22
MTLIDRRNLLTLAGATLLAGLAARQARAFDTSAGQAFDRAISQVDHFSSDVLNGSISIANWRESLDHVFSSLDPNDVRQAIEFDHLLNSAGTAERGVATAPVRLQLENGDRLAFFPKFFSIGRGRAIIPHGHSNMISAHLTLQGRFHLRQYDRIGVEADALLIRPTIDEVVTAGSLASIGDPDDNIHWFIAEEQACTLDIIITNLDATAPSAFDIFNIDPMEATALGQDIWRAPRLSVAEGLAKYG